MQMIVGLMADYGQIVDVLLLGLPRMKPLAKTATISLSSKAKINATDYIKERHADSFGCFLLRL